MQILLLVCSLLVSLITIWVGSQLSSGWREGANAIGLGLLVSAVFGMAQSVVTDPISKEILRQSITEEVRGALTHLHTSYIPTHEFPPSDQPGIGFNALMTEDLHASSTYWYRGIHTKFCAARFSMLRSSNLQAHLILPDPTVPHSLDARSEYRVAQASESSLTLQEIRESTLRSIWAGLVGLFLVRNKCGSIEVLLVSTPSLDRFEIFQNSAWVTLFSDMDQGTRFPRAMRFPHESLIYRMQEAECLAIRRSPTTRRFEISRTTTEEEFVSLFSALTGQDLTPELLTELRTNYEGTANRFRSSIRPQPAPWPR
ncbi:hypothetical protein [Streptomyces pseudovenezuelae]|uniref:hypothetical protein n=1 Tax=Streptomyces pseudovenezuelae TaxID=67350 RepID=UPI002E801BD0|nr:hypothetical protein [Streptomyces pseudovenezuelae]WUA91172.1 hypothetical protein OHO81_29455 [Streptomyces pseudovenezuelae]